MKVDGACHCGRIRYEAEIDPARVVICHCTDCQTLSGTAFSTVVATKPGSFVLRSGEPRIYVKQAESGNERQQAFCPDCGTPLYSAPPVTGARVFGLRVGSIRQRDQLVPTEQIWCRSAQAWLADLPAIRKTMTQPAFGPQGGFERPS